MKIEFYTLKLFHISKCIVYVYVASDIKYEFLTVKKIPIYPDYQEKVHMILII